MGILLVYIIMKFSKEERSRTRTLNLKISCSPFEKVATQRQCIIVANNKNYECGHSQWKKKRKILVRKDATLEAVVCHFQWLCQVLALMSDTHKPSAQNKLNPNHSVSETVTLENKLYVESLKDINGKQTKGLPVTTKHRTPDPSLATRLHRP